MVGSDAFYTSPKIDVPVSGLPQKENLELLKRFLGLLPAEVSRKVAFENADKIYKLSE